MIGKFSLVSREALIISTMVVYIKFHMPSICQFRMLIEAASPDGSKGYLPFLKGRVSESRKSDITAFFFLMALQAATSTFLKTLFICVYIFMGF